ncbi:monovalent cation/H(+) antiporter subunit G [Ancylobacter dichloromethanicus]|uniref:K(+)/H(+) antiporter subunit G n=1 Tax=Ancylobacter dichloromethanicus TaxID=518825 RepID=A0A9W6MYD3_9HYPH|nr:monovalent cation/H(+) antiporter subunit G [Ancylobacter dichloromethanicus]MBS7553826.1 monovalent cation/H(+) antiporter subunit G [Ancylobacter dichloromethanicus]GLK70931.1 putative K(+)/H(+) antiporter subunit G [Ancylobacter dichloromethanicus]
MSGAPELPLWAAILVSFLLVFGALVTLIGSVGLWRLPDFYARLHAPSLGATLGTGAILIGSMVCFSVLQGRPLIHEVLIGLFVTITTPVTLMLLASASLYRDRVEGNDAAPGKDPEPTEL